MFVYEDKICLNWYKEDVSNNVNILNKHTLAKYTHTHTHTHTYIHIIYIYVCVSQWILRILVINN